MKEIFWWSDYKATVGIGDGEVRWGNITKKITKFLDKDCLKIKCDFYI